jgi:hypothetical protein
MRVFTVGFPAGRFETATYTEGVISALPGEGERGQEWYIQVSVPIHKGNSGGPLVNDRGEVVGIAVETASPMGYFERFRVLPQNIGWAVKADYAARLFPRPPPSPGDPSWLLGTWEGHHSSPVIHMDSSRFEFTAGPDGIRWTLSRRTTPRNWTGNLYASGLVRSLTESTVELEGRYDGFSEGRTAGAPLRYRLKRRGDSLEGDVVGREGTIFAWS